MWVDFVAITLLLVIIAFLMTPRPGRSFINLEIGEKVWQDIRSPFTFTVVDTEATGKRQRDAVKLILPVYDYDSQLNMKLNQKVTEIFAQWRQRLREKRIREGLNEKVGPPTKQEYFSLSKADTGKSEYEEFVSSTGVNISRDSFELLKRLGFPIQVEQCVRACLRSVLEHYSIVANRNLMLETAPHGFTRKDLVTGQEKNLYNLDLVISVEDAWREMDLHAQRYFSDNQIFQDISAELARALIRANLTPNMQETRARIEQAKKSVKPVFYMVSAGEVIARNGDRVTREMKIRLDQMNKMRHKRRLGLIFLGNFALLSLFLVVVGAEIKRFHKALLKDKSRLTLIGVIAVFEVLFIRLFFALAKFIPDAVGSAPFNQVEPYYYAIPYAVGAMLLALLIDVRIAVLASFIFGVISGLVVNKDIWIGIYAMSSSCAAVFGITQYKQRTMVLQTGFVVSLVNLFVSLVIWSLRGALSLSDMALTGMMTVINGILVAMIVTILLPILEWLFRIPTDIRLLELSNFNQPLLRRLAMEAPGTHHHSLMVGDLAEAAAEAIHANALLARVGAYYHDIGKIKKPLYFIENMQGKNVHDQLMPSMSSIVIRNHVRQGVELARKSGLGQDIIDIIEQHHGTSLLTYFYDKAEDGRKQSRQGLPEEHFRYPGPKPRSKEAAIVLIADAVEAAARSLKSPSSAALKSLVRKITLSKYQDNQFDDCDLTFRELTIIVETLYKRLLRNYHSRIEYPRFNFNHPEKENAETEKPKVKIKENIREKAHEYSGK